MAEMSDERVKNICRDLLDREAEALVRRDSCILRHKNIESEVKTMKEDGERKNQKIDSIHKLAYGIMGGIIVSLAVQLINLASK